MPWKETVAMEERIRFVLQAREEGRNLAQLCREFGISRKTGYKWVERYESRGLDGLGELSRRPWSCPWSVNQEMVCDVIRERRSHPTWGPKKLRKLLERRGLEDVPSQATIGRILERCGMIPPERRRRARQKVERDGNLIKPEVPNDVWTADYKGWWRLRDGSRCEPLTIKDLRSRFLIRLKGMKRISTEEIKAEFREAFNRYGLPRVLRTDNGSPFAARSLRGLSRFSVWLLKLGITPNRIVPAKPSQNGSHERTHRDMKAELQNDPAETLWEQQVLFDEWAHEYNYVRPHESLNQETPATLYVKSPRRYDPREPDPVYPKTFDAARVTHKGYLRIGRSKLWLSEALCEELVGIETNEDSSLTIWYNDFGLGRITDLSQPRFEPLGAQTQARMCNPCPEIDL